MCTTIKKNANCTTKKGKKLYPSLERELDANDLPGALEGAALAQYAIYYYPSEIDKDAMR